MRVTGFVMTIALLAVAGTAAWAWRNNGPTAPLNVEMPAPDNKNEARVPVIVELFTSEGCSNCPPADVVLQNLETQQPIAGVEIIPLSLHVDYWNYIGWADPYSAAAFSARQSAYSAAFGKGQVYTPQMVVDGSAEFVGSRAERAQAAIREAAQQPKATVTLTRQDEKNGVLTLAAKVAQAPATKSGDIAEVLLAVTESGLSSSVTRGENAGRKLPHTAVVRQLETLGTVNSKEFAATPAITLKNEWQRANLRAVVLVQERQSRRILGAATVSLK